ncbi:MAG TPA: AAA family ATPase [Gaiellaceae bacterium]|nr:AAA family ATPase [Gaiellaceae bacterium]
MSVATERKLVTVLFCDLVGSTALGEALDVEAVGAVQAAYFDRTRSVVEQFGGSVEKFAGDAVVAVFGVPLQHEDDAERAVHCALALRDALVGLSDTLRPRFGVDLELRVGIATGDAVVGGTEALATGDVMNTAARLEQAAGPGQVLVGHDTMRLTIDAVDYGAEVRVEAKGKREPVPAWPALHGAAQRTRASSPLVGRSAELEVLADALERAIRERTPQAVVVLGEPGIGKSRLVEEFEARVRGRARVFRGACLPYGEGGAWLPLAAVVRGEAAIGEADGEAAVRAKLHTALGPRHSPEELPLVEAQLAALAARAPAGSEHELLWSVRRYLEALASTGPLVVVLDDLHWADDILVGAVQDLFQALAPAPLAFLFQGRPELRDRMTELVADDRVRVLQLGALRPHEATALVDNLADPAWTAEVRAAIVARGEGSPLFLEEISAVAGEDGLDAGVPRSLRALIGARLDLFPPEVKRIAQACAVVGGVFWDAAVAAVEAGDGAAPALRRLRMGGFIDEQPESAFLGARQFRFHHALVREVTYESIPKLDRSELHRRAAEWLAGHDGRPDLGVAIAHHLTQAVSLRREVAPLEVVDPGLVHAAVDAARAAAAWTAATASVHQATELLRTAVDIAGDDPEAAELARAQLASVLARSGAADEAAGLAEQILADNATPEGAALAYLALAEVARVRGDLPGMTEAGTHALELAEPLGLRGIEIEAHDIAGLADTWAGRLSSGVEHRRRATEIAFELGDLPRAAFCLAGHSAIALLELGRLDEAERQVGEAMRLAIETGSLRALEAAHAVLVFLRRAQDRLEEAVAHAQERVVVAEKLGEALWLFNALTVNLARTLIELGRLDEAWAALDRALDVDTSGGVRGGLVNALRAQILVARGRLDEADAALTAVPWPDAYFELALLREAQGRSAEADEVWRRVLEEFAGTETRLERAEMIVGYARFLAGQGRHDEARARLAEAYVLVDGTGAALIERLIREVEAAV